MSEPDASRCCSMINAEGDPVQGDTVPTVAGLLVCVDGSASDSEAEACRALFDELTRRGSTHELLFVDQLDAVEVTRPDDLPTLRTVGWYLELPEPDSSPSESAVRKDVEQLIAAASELAGETGVEFVVEYEAERIGWLQGGSRGR